MSSSEKAEILTVEKFGDDPNTPDHVVMQRTMVDRAHHEQVMGGVRQEMDRLLQTGQAVERGDGWTEVHGDDPLSPALDALAEHESAQTDSSVSVFLGGKKFAEGWDLIFGKKEDEEDPEQN